MPRDPRAILEISAEALKKRLDQGEALALLDVREPRERSFCAIPLPAAAVDLHVPLRRVASQLEEIRHAAQTGLLVVYCHHGIRSRQAAEWLAHQGVGEVANLEGGIDAWSTGVDTGVPRY
jgi:rhodanese-related sulfurtransferase